MYRRKYIFVGQMFHLSFLELRLCAKSFIFFSSNFFHEFFSVVRGEKTRGKVTQHHTKFLTTFAIAPCCTAMQFILMVGEATREGLLSLHVATSVIYYF